MFRSKLSRVLGLARGHYQLGGARGLARLAGALALRKVLPLSEGRGAKGRHCPCCGWEGVRFLPYVAGGYVHFDSECAVCRSQARHRGHRLLYERVLKLHARAGRVLYFAPEQGMLAYFRGNQRLEVVTVDYQSPGVQARVDIAQLPFAPRTFELIICHRVIEHVADDRQAMRELLRVLKPGGELILSVPISSRLSSTLEFGKPNPLLDDHYRDYGEDFAERFPEGLDHQVLRFADHFDRAEQARLALDEDRVFLCRARAV